jgi:mannose-6-phosphate isomerase-like protein (cupin superfamily)
MKITKSSEFSPANAWDAMLIANMQGVTCRLHWTDQPYRWHVNDGEEVFVVLDGQVVMHCREDNEEFSQTLNRGDIFYANIGCEHLAVPIGEARVFVVEKEGSV